MKSCASGSTSSREEVFLCPAHTGNIVAQCDRLDFEFDNDQTFVNETLLGIERLLNDYIGMRGEGRD